MNYVINAHLRRHDTYRSWFEYRDDARIVRRTIQNPNDIKFVPTKRGEMVAEDFHQLILDTPIIAEWDCFSFGIIQHEDHFTFYVIVEPRAYRSHADGVLVRRDPSDLRRVARRRCAPAASGAQRGMTTTAFASINTRRR